MRLLLPLLAAAAAASSTLVRAADVSASMGLVAYFTSACPNSDWTDLSSDDTYRGRVIKGTTTTPGQTFGSPISTDADVGHTHTSWYSVLSSSTWPTLSPSGASPSTLQPTPCPKPTTCGANSVVAVFATSRSANYVFDQTSSSMTTNSSSLPFVSLVLCKFSGTTPFMLPAGAVAYVTAPTCPSSNGWGGDFTDADGRLMVFAPSSTPVNSGTVMSPATPVTTLIGLGNHTHTLNSFSFVPFIYTSVGRFNTLPAATTLAVNFAITPQPTPSPVSPPSVSFAPGSVGPADLGIPYVALRACIATDSAGGTTVLPPSSAIFYFNQDCPATWRESSGIASVGANILNRFVWNYYAGQGNSLNTARGGSALNGITGHDTHGHVAESGSTSYSGFSDTQLNMCACGGGTSISTSIMDPGSSSSYYFTTTTANPQNGNYGANLMPYRIMRACSPPLETGSPTTSPTHVPTKRPTLSNSATTVSPTTPVPTDAPNTLRGSTSSTGQMDIVPIAAGVGGGLGALLVISAIVIGYIVLQRRAQRGQELGARA